MTPNYKITVALAMGLLVVSSVIGLALGQGGTGRTNTNSSKPASKRATPAKRPARSGGVKPRPTPARTSIPESTEAEFWETIRNSSDPQEFKDYLQAYPNGAHSALARTRVRQLEAAKTTPTNPKTTGSSLSNVPPTFTNQTGIEFVLIPPGNFMMGSNNGKPDEKPVHQVAIGYSFYLGKYEVTQAQWQSVMGSNPSNFKNCRNCPVEQVSWSDAQEFIRLLNQMNDGYAYRLPTEAEWEYACRSGTTGDYAGDLDAMAWHYENSGDSRLSGDWNPDLLKANNNRTHTVGSKAPNAFGLYDMHGNVSEWCEDWYHFTYRSAPTDGGAWLTGSAQQHRVLRGGSYDQDALRVRSAYRFISWLVSPNVRTHTKGFRVAAIPLTSTNSTSTNPTSSTANPTLVPPEARNLQSNETKSQTAADAATEKVFRADEVDQRVQVLEKPPPSYTEEARKNQVTGTVVLRAVLSSTGEVTNVTVVRGLPDGLTERVIAAAKKLKFKQAMKDGKPVSQYVQLQYNLNLY